MSPEDYIESRSGLVYLEILLYSVILARTRSTYPPFPNPPAHQAQPTGKTVIKSLGGRNESPNSLAMVGGPWRDNAHVKATPQGRIFFKHVLHYVKLTGLVCQPMQSINRDSIAIGPEPSPDPNEMICSFPHSKKREALRSIYNLAVVSLMWMTSIPRRRFRCNDSRRCLLKMHINRIDVDEDSARTAALCFESPAFP